MRENIYQSVPAGFHAQLMETLERLPEEKKRKTVSVPSARKWLVPLAAVLALGTMTAAAAGIFKWHEAAKNRFGVNDELEDKLTMDGIARSENTVVNEDGMELQLLQSVRTDDSMYYLCQVTLPDGMEIDEDTVFESFDYEADVEIGGLTVDFVNDSQNEGQHLLELVLYLADGIDYAGQEVTVHLYNLVQTEKTEVTGVLLEGEWEIPVTLSEDVDTVSYEVNRQMAFDGHILQVRKVEAGPFWLKLYMDQQESQHAFQYSPIAVTGVRKTDGSLTEEEAYLNTAGHADDSTGDFYYLVDLSSAIDPAQVSGVVFNHGACEISFGAAAGREADLMAAAGKWETGEAPAGSKVIQERYGKAVVTDGDNLYLQDMTCGKILPILDLGTLSFDAERGGEIVPFGTGTVYILSYEGSDVVYVYEVTENDQGEHSIYEREAEEVLSSDSYQSHREIMLKNQ